MADYVKSLEVLQRIRELAGSDLKLPQMCAVGDQSSGKSAVLARLTGIDFPVKDGICTKAAIVVECRRDISRSMDKYEVRTAGTEDAGGSSPRHAVVSEYEEYPASQLAQRITSIQNQALLDAGKKILDQEILVRVTGPAQMDIIVIDLPGIINQGDGVNETRALIEKYISQEETLILLVSEAKQDEELVTAMGMAKIHDPFGVRTMRILTKFDSFDSEEAQERAVALVNGEHDRDADTGAQLGAHALICRPSGKKEFDPVAEREKLEGLGMAHERCGVESLKDRLPSIYARLIRTNLPKLRASIEEHREAARAKLSEMGTEPVEGQSMIKTCQEALLARMTGVDEVVSEAILRFQDKIHSTGEELTKEWTDAKLRPNVFECSIFQGNEALRACMADVAEGWRPIMEELIEEVQLILQENVKAVLFGSLRGVPQHLRDTMVKQWRARCTGTFTRLSTQCSGTLAREIDFGTVNHYFTAKFAAERAFPEEVVRAFLESVTTDDVYSPPNADNNDDDDDAEELSYIRANLERKLLDQRAIYEKKFESKTLHEQQQERLFAAVKALWAVEHKTFIDVIVKDIRSGPRRDLKDWVQRELLTCPEIQKRAVEDLDIWKARSHYKEQERKMEASLRELESLGEGLSIASVQ